MRVEIFNGLADLPARYLGLLEAQQERCLFQGRLWYETLLATARDPGDAVRLYGVASGGPAPRALALLVARAPAQAPGLLRPRTLAEFANFYSLEAGPVLDPGLDDPGPALDALLGALRAETPRWDAVQIGPVRRPSPLYEALIGAFRRHGMAVEPFFKHGTWYEAVTGRDFEQYIAGLGRRAKETLRKARKLEREHAAGFEVVTDAAGLEAGLAAYDAVYGASWKEPEIYPDFMPRLIRDCARAGRLRLGNLFVDGEPAATQLYILSGPSAVMLKMAYVPKFAALSSGAIVMARMLRHLVAEDRVGEIDLGGGDEPYKASWATRRREKWALLAYDTATPAGRLAAAAAGARAALKTARRWLPRRGEG